MFTVTNKLLVMAGGGLVVLATMLVIVVLVIAKRRGAGQTGGSHTNKLASSLRDERARSNIIVNAIDDGVVLVDMQQTIELFNPGAAQITGWTSGDATGLAWQAVFKFVNKKGEPVDNAQEPMARLLTTKETVRDNAANLMTKSGKVIATDIVLSPVIDEQKTFTGAVCIFRDVSEERQEEAQRAEFISTASHEMRTPVAAIEGYLSLALNDKVSTVDSRARGYLEKAHSSTEHLGKLFQDLLTSAKAEDGRLTSHPEVIEIGSFLEQLTNDLRFAAEKKNLMVEFVFGQYHSKDANTASTGDKVVNPLYYAYADPGRLREVVTNIFDNAVKYTEAGKISIGLTGNEQVVQFFIRDTGVGIPPEDIPHMFQKFYRVDSSATRTIGGTGLGLFISRKIIELYGGRVWVESELGKGSTFYLNLPRLGTARAEELKTQAAEATILQPVITAT